jgi:hypothetical protein
MKLKDATKNLTQFTAKLAQEVQDELNNINAKINRIEAVISAVVNVIGESSVNTELAALRDGAEAKNVEKQTANVKYLIDSKVLLPIDTVAMNSFVVGVEKLDEGNVEHRVQFEVAGLNPEVSTKVVGSKVGDTIKNAKSSLVIREIYDIDAAQAEKTIKPPLDAAPAAQA